MSHLRAFGRRIGRLPSALVVAAANAALLVGAQFVDWSDAWLVIVPVVALLAGYCCLRATRRGDVFGAFMAPGCFSGLANAVTGVNPGFVAIPILLLSLAVLADDDRLERRARTAARA